MVIKYKSKQVRISDLIVPQAIVLDLEGDYVDDICSRLVKLLLKERKKRTKRYSLSSFYEILYKLIVQEELGTTALGGGIALPHPYTHIPEYIFTKPVISIGISQKGLRWLLPYSQDDYRSFDEKPVHVVFLALVPFRKEKPQSFLKIMAELSMFRDDKQLMDNLRKATNIKEILQIIKRKEKDKKKIEIFKKIHLCDKCRREIIEGEDPIYLSIYQITYLKTKRGFRQKSYINKELCLNCAMELQKKILALEWKYPLNKKIFNMYKTKKCCDKCGKEIIDLSMPRRSIKFVLANNLLEFNDLCNKCAKELTTFILKWIDLPQS